MKNFQFHREGKFMNKSSGSSIVCAAKDIPMLIHAHYILHTQLRTHMPADKQHRDLESLCKSPGVALILVQPLGLMGQRIFVE